MSTTIPLTKDCCYILMNTVNKNIDIISIQHALKNLPEVEDVHSLHIFDITVGKTMASCHLVVNDSNGQNHSIICNCVKEFLHSQGIHSTTIQVDYIDGEDKNK